MAASAAFVPRVVGSEEDTQPIVIGLDEGRSVVAVRLSQDESISAESSGGHPSVSLEILATAGSVSVDAVRRSVEEIFSLDRDGSAFMSLGVTDEVVGRLQRLHPGLRPALYPSVYEAAARAIIMHRISRGQAASVTQRLSDEIGGGVDFGGRSFTVFPAPERLSDLGAQRGLSARKVEQLAELGRLAADGRFERQMMRAMGPEEAMSHLRQIPGIGPFSAELILIRGVGDPDVFPRTELSLHRGMAQAYGLGPDPTIDTLDRIAEQWRPFRSWVGLLFRHLEEGASR
jgi:DNA-3-methyladenine glycosylase II